MDGSGYSSTLGKIGGDRIEHVSFRFYWNMIETNEDTYSSSAVNAYKDLVEMADSYGLTVDVTFWTQFQTGAEDPWWIKDTSGYNPSYKATNSYVKTEWIEWVNYMVNQFEDYTCIGSWQIMNEPFYSSGEQDEFESLITDMVSNITAEDDNDKIISCRFTSSYSPASGKYSNDIYDLFDVMSITVYNHYDTYSQADTRTDPLVYNSRWWMYKDTVADCAARDLPLWIIEFGCASNSAGWGTISDATWTAHYTGVLNIFDNDGVKRAYAWAWRTSSPSVEAFNLYLEYGTVRPAYNVLLNYLPEDIEEPQYFYINIASGMGGTTNPTTGEYNDTVGDTFSVVASANIEYEFSYWLLNGSTYTTSTTINIAGTNGTVYNIQPYFSASSTPPPEPPPEEPIIPPITPPTEPPTYPVEPYPSNEPIFEGYGFQIFVNETGGFAFDSGENRTFMIEVLDGTWNGTNVRLSMNQRGGSISFYSNSLAYIQLENWYEETNARLQVDGVTVSGLSPQIWNGTIPAYKKCVIHWSWSFLLPHEENFLFWVGLLGLIMLLFGLMIIVYNLRHKPIFSLSESKTLIWESDTFIIAICMVIIGAGLVVTWLLS